VAAREELDKLRRLRELEARVGSGKRPTAAEKPAPEGGVLKRFGQGIADRADVNVRKVLNLEHDLGRGMLNLAGADMPDLKSSNPISTEAIRAREAEAAPVGETGAGMAGGLVADMAMTAPLGVIGKGMEAVSAARGVPRALGQVLGSRPAQAAVEGGVAGMTAADPEARGEGAFEGATTGAVLERGGRLLGRTLEGLVRRTPEAHALEQVADLHQADVKLPLATAASDEGIISPMMKFIYGKVLPNLPGAEGTLNRQAQRAGTQFREIAMKEAAPGGMGSTSKGYAAALPLTTAKTSGAGENVRMSMKDIQNAFEKEYRDTIKSYSFNQPNTTDFAARLQQQFPNIDDDTLNGVAQTFDTLSTRYSKNGVLDGDNLVRMKTQLAKLGREAGDDRLGQSFFQAQEFLDDVVRQELRVGGQKQNLEDLQRYEDLAEPWKNFSRVQKAAARSKDPEGMFTPQELMRAVKSSASDRELARGAAPMQELASLGERTAGKELHQPHWGERVATGAALGSAGFFGSPLATAGILAGGRAMASPAVQDVLMGTTNTQRALTQALRNRPNAKRLIGADIRNMGAAEVANDE
jgi:hypothetical protein